MTAVRKYGFDTVFSDTGEVLRDSKGHRTIYTQAEVDEACAAAFAQGQASEIARAEKAAADAAQALAKQMQLVVARLDSETKTLRREALALAMAAARANAGAALERFGEERALAVAQEALAHLRGAPHLLARIPEASAERLEPRLRAAAADHGMAEALVVRPDPKARPGDISLEWSEGRIGVSAAEVEDRLQSLAAELARELEADGR